MTDGTERTISPELKQALRGACNLILNAADDKQLRSACAKIHPLIHKVKNGE